MLVYTFESYITKLEQESATFVSTNAKKSVDSMVALFNRKKSAHELSKTSIRQTGSIDTKRIAYHKTSENIFRTKKYEPIGKNHGFVFLVDFSGSMREILPSVIRQSVIYAMFCKRINVPFKVISFTDENTNWSVPHGDVDGLTGYDDIKMNVLFDNSSSHQDFVDMLTTISIGYGLYRSGGLPIGGVDDRRKYSDLVNKVRKEFDLGMTPLHRCTIIAGMECRKMQLSGIEKVNLICITDGVNTESLNKSDDTRNKFGVGKNMKSQISRMISPFTGKSYNLNDYSKHISGDVECSLTSMSSSVYAANEIVKEIGVSVQNLFILKKTTTGKSAKDRWDIISQLTDFFTSYSKSSGYNTDKKVSEKLYDEMTFIGETLSKLNDFMGYEQFLFASDCLFGIGDEEESVFKEVDDMSKMSTTKIAKIMATKMGGNNALVTLNNLVVEKVCESFR